MSDWHVLGLDGDPTPGDPDRTGDLAGKLLHQAELADRNRTRLDAVAQGGGDLRMEGDYAPKFREVLSELPGELGKLSNAYRGAGEALKSFASDLRTEKAKAATALRNGTDAATRYDGALREIRSLLPAGKELVVSPMLGVEASVEQATEGLDEGIRTQARAAARRAALAKRDKTAARRMAQDAARLRGDAEGRAVEGINRALDHSGIKNKSFWEKAWDVVSWPFQSWDNFVTFCKGVALVVGTIALFVSGPVGWALVAVALVAGAVEFGDTLAKFVQGKASLADLGLAALGLIPGSAGALRLANLARAGPRLLAMAKNLPDTGRVVLGGLRNVRTAIPFGLKSAGGIRAALSSPRAFARPALCRFIGRDPIDMATGEMILQQDPDLQLPGILPVILQRTYRSAYRVGRWFGPSWSSTLEHRLEIDDYGVCYASGDGLLFAYPMPAEGETVLPEEGPRLPLHRDAHGFAISDPTSGWTLSFGDGSSIDLDGRSILPLAAITDRNDNRIVLDYDADDLLTTIRHSGGYRLDVDAPQGLITELRLRTEAGEPEQVVMRYDYDESGNLVGVVNSSGLPQRFDYDEQGRMTRWEDRNGIWYRYTYDDLGRCVATSGTGGCLDGTISYDEAGRTTVETNSLGHSTSYHFNDRLQMERVVDPLGGVTLHEWDRYDRKLAETDPLGRTTRYSYDEAGNVVVITRPDGSTITSAYNELRQPVTIAGPDRAVWRHRYDERGNLLGVINPLGAETTYAYDEQGRVHRVVDALGQASQINNDAAGLPVAVTDPLGRTTRLARDAFGRVVELTDALGGVTRLRWTVEGRLAARTLPDGTTERWVHDPEGNLVEEIDALGQITRTEFVLMDCPGSTTGPDGARLMFGYDTELRVVSVTNPLGLVWHYEYDPAGNLVRETDFNGRVLTYAHDAAGQIVEHTNGAGETMRFVHDALGNVVEQRSAGAVSRFSYDPLGRLTNAVNADCVVSFDRDALGQVLAETCNDLAVTSVYDALGRRVERQTPSGATSGWEYDAANRPLSLSSAGRTLHFAHDALGREVERRLDGITIAQTWDAAHRLRSQEIVVPGPGALRDASVAQRRSYAYRADGYLVETDDLQLGRRRLDLDPVGRIRAVTSTEGSPWSERYAYDPAGNVTSATWPVPTAGTGPSATDGPDTRGARRYTGLLVRQAGACHYGHDAQGRVVHRGEQPEAGSSWHWRYAWDAEDRLTGVAASDGRQWRYRYDPLGRRIAKEQLSADGTTVAERIKFSWDGFLIAEQIRDETLSGTGPEDPSTTWDWEPGSLRLVAQTQRSSAGDSPQAAIDERFYAIVTGPGDAPGDLISADGSVTVHRDSTVWGIVVAGESDRVECPLRFPGQYFDRETQSHYNFLRHYDPWTARYLTCDPVGVELEPNPYTYAPNPWHWADPLGLGLCSTNRDLVQEVARRAERKIGGAGRIPGIRKHAYAKKILDRYQNVFGDRGLRTEVSYLKNALKGGKGSVRLDVEELGSGIVYDYKFTRDPVALGRSQVDRIVTQAHHVNFVIPITPW